MEKYEYLKEQFEEYGFNPTEKQIQQFIDYYEILIETNKQFNLTAITEWEEVVRKHFIDSILPLQCFKVNSTLLDIGAGAGFPSIPLKIMRPDLNITMLDSLNKRVNFMNDVVARLELMNIKAIHSRCEDYVNVSRETFDYVVARAVAQMPTLCEYCLPYCKIGGQMIAYKGNVKEELSQSKIAIDKLGGKFSKLLEYELIKENRTVVVIDKIQSTPNKYPRQKNLPRTKPLM